MCVYEKCVKSFVLNYRFTEINFLVKFLQDCSSCLLAVSYEANTKLSSLKFQTYESIEACTMYNVMYLLAVICHIQTLAFAN